MKKVSIFLFISIAIVGLLYFFVFSKKETNNTNENLKVEEETQNIQREKKEDLKVEKKVDLSMAIESLREQEYPTGDFVIEKNLDNGTNYKQSIVSYRSENLKIFGLLTVPLAQKQEKGFPAIVFVHGYIQPSQYSTTGNYPSYQATLARAGFVTFKPDLRGHGQSEGEAVGAHFSEKYTIDTLNAIAYLKNDEAVDSDRLGYWGHSNGGETGLRVAVVSKKISRRILFGLE